MSALVVGGHGAIGSAVAVALRARGLPVHVLDRATGVDATDPAQVDAALALLDPAPTRLVHVAGSVGRGGLLDTGLDSWHTILDDNLTSAFVVCKSLLPGLLAAGGGSIVLTGSVNGRHGGNALSGPAYAAAKAGIVALARNIAKEFGPRGVRANVVAPGPVASRMTDRLEPDALDRLLATVPAGRLATPEEIAGSMVHVLEDAAYINGAVLDVNGGMWMG